MATVPAPWQLIWEILKENSGFLVKKFGRGTMSVQFSKESNNLYNLNSYKQSTNLILQFLAALLFCSVAVNTMATVTGQLICEIMKNSGFSVEFHRGNTSVQFSKENKYPYNLDFYKHSGLANKKTVTVQSGGKDQSVLLTTSKTKMQNKPVSLLHKSVLRKEFPSMAKAVVNQVADNYYRPDLEKAALARLSAVHRSLKVAKSGVKKKNRQAVRIRSKK